MPIKKAAIKALRQSQKKEQKNKILKSEIATLKKNMVKLIDQGKQSEAKEIWLKLQKKFDKAAKNNIIQKNTVNRMKSRLMAKFNSKFKK